MNREKMLAKLIDRDEPFELAVVGGGATGAAIAMDAASRGLTVALLEKNDFGKGTSSRSTKLIHGGVRYLEQGNLVLVRDALRERSLLLKNANHLVHDLEFILPCRGRWESFYFGMGLWLYDLLARSSDFGRARRLSKSDVAHRLPTLNPAAFYSGWLYHDGQFDDARLVINFVQTAVQLGAVVANYATVTGLTKDSHGKLSGVQFQDAESGISHVVPARTVINAAGPFGDSVRRLDRPNDRPMLAASQGIHLVLPPRFLPGSTALIVPRTRDGRVMFLIPWHGQTLVGTTDTPIDSATEEPSALPAEIEFLLNTAAEYLAEKPEMADVHSVFVGVRPLVLGKSGSQAKTSAISRDHVVHVAKSNLITIAGGKWTTVRKMAEDAVDRAITVGRLARRPCVTKDLAIHGSGSMRSRRAELQCYGSDGIKIDEIIDRETQLGSPMHPDLSINRAQVLWAVHHEMARTVEDVLARRTRCLFLNARATQAIAPQVTELIASELGRDANWQHNQCQQFRITSQNYVLE